MKNKIIWSLVVVVLLVGVAIWHYSTKGEAEVCAQVVTDGRNPATGEIKSFPTPCDVPEGWDTLEGSGNQTFVENGVTYQRYRNSDLGLSFAYKISPDGYTLIEENVSNVSDSSLEKYFTLFNTKQYQEFKSAKEAHDGPPVISVMIFKNPENMHADVWLKEHAFVANYREGSRLDKIDLGGSSGVTYHADGLYQNEVIVLENNYKIYLFSGAYNAPSDQIFGDFYHLMDGVILF
jgi:hypothetical protein